MPTALFTPVTAATNTADQTIPAGGQLTFGLYQAAGGNLPSGFDAPITRKNPSGTYDATGLSLNAANPNQVIAAGGVFRVEKPVTAVAVGVDVD